MTLFSEVELIQDFLAQYSLEWLLNLGRHYVFCDASGKVAAVSIEFDAESPVAPSPEQVLGISVTASDDGSIYARVRRPEKGYWICYSRIGDNASDAKVTVQKMNLPPDD